MTVDSLNEAIRVGDLVASYLFAPIFCFVIFLVMFEKGVESLVQNRSLFRSITMMVVGWLSGLASMLLFICWLLGHLFLSEDVG